MTATVGVVLPAYRPDLHRLESYVTALDREVAPDQLRIEVDDADADVRAGLADLPATVNVVPYRRGKGAAITDGFEALDTDVLAFTDADGSTPPDQLAAVIHPVLDGRVDLSTGSRRHPDASVERHQTFARRFMGDAFAWVARRLLAVSLFDYQCGAKAISADAWGTVREHLYEPGFAWDVELVAIAGAFDLSVAEVPIEWHDAPGSTVSPVRDAWRLGRALLRARHRAHQLRDDSLHTAIAARREQPTALVDDE